jgi:hypothetical protein
MRSEDPFARFAAAGLAIMFGLQSAINMAVNLHLMPAKGMTLPFISYGGSSMISIAYGMGMLLALTRERPRAELLASQNEFVPVGVRPDLSGPAREVDRAAVGRVRPRPCRHPTHDPRRAAGRRRDRRPSVSRRGARRALGRRGIVVDLATDERAERYGRLPGATHSHRHQRDRARPRPVSLGAHRGAARVRTLQACGCSGASRRPPWSASAATRRAAGAGGDAAQDPDADPRTERRDGPRQPAAGRRVKAIATSFAGVLDREPSSPPRRRAPATRCGRR